MGKILKHVLCHVFTALPLRTSAKHDLVLSIFFTPNRSTLALNML